MLREYVRYVICSKKQERTNIFDYLTTRFRTYTITIGADINGTCVSGENANWQHVLYKFLYA